MPAQLLSNQRRISHQRGRIAGAARSDGDSKIPAGRLPDSIDNLLDRISVSVSKVKRMASFLALKLIQRQNMGSCEIGNMNVIPNACAVGRIVIISKDGEVRTLSRRRIQGQRYNVGFILSFQLLAFSNSPPCFVL